jgi:hypothetical protein
MRLNRRILAPLFATLVFFGVAGSSPVKAAFLSDLLVSGATFTFDGLTFSNFTYTPPTGPPPPTAITITGVVDAFGNPGIQIGGAFVQIGVGSTDVRLGYTVTGANFTDIHMSGNPFVGPGTVGVASISETVSAPNVGTVGSLLLDSSTNPPEVGTTFGGKSYSTLVVQKDILLSVQGGTATNPNASISFINQTFSVPEPASLALMGIGCFGLIGYGFRRKMAVTV